MTGPYAQAQLGQNISTMETQDDAQDDAVRSFERGAVEPTIKPIGLLYNCLNTTILTAVGAAGLTEATVRWAVGGAWALYADPTKAQINAGGTIAFAADQAMGTHRFTGLSAGTAAGHSVRYEQVMLLAGGNAMTADLDMGTHKIVNLAAPVSANDAIRKADLGEGIPPNVCMHYYQTNRDIRGNSRPVVVNLQASSTTTYTNVGRVPRRLKVRISGNFRKQSDNTDAGQVDLVGAEYECHRWDADAAGGEAGTDPTVTVGAATPTSGGAPHVDIIIIWKFAPGDLGFFIKFLRSDGVWCDLKKIGDPSSAGSIQIQSWFGEGT